MQECLFCSIAKGQTDTIFLYEDDELVAFRDISPQAPFHILIVPKAHMQSAATLTEDEGSILGRVFNLAARLAAQDGYTNGYRIVTNVGEEGGQTVPHLHFHVLAGRNLGWPPG
ncbi:histidine triad nucleotide-binding protein [Ruminococcaceae bacterium OttesenSCG-928-O06]|nr:histidine triad nucleotide-binding protein [Ruminococcaceae bacterium OttesenSCG-928-O06]